MGIKVLSLFDGISCGMLALKRAGLEVDLYDAYEIEESAIKISKINWPEIRQKGDVFEADYTMSNYDVLIGGSPCTYWSIARTNAERETTSSGIGFELFKQYVRAKEETGARYFLYENNNSISKEIQKEITKYLGVEPVMVDSSLVSAQARKRLYWTNIPGFKMPEDKGIMLKDIIVSGKVDREKSLCIARRTVGNRGSQSYMRRRYFGKSFAQMVFEGCEPEEQKKMWKEDPQKEFDSEGYIRPLEIIEMERLQTLPDNYTKVEGVTESQRGEAIGNGWTVDVIVEFMKALKNAITEEEKIRMKSKRILDEMIQKKLIEAKNEEECLKILDKILKEVAA